LTETPQVNTANPISPPSPRVNPRENGVFWASHSPETGES
jgi:hypothetical protein